MAKKYLPIGIQTFRDFKERNYQYVDKTDLIYKLVTEGQYYFFARPRRFGKSLLLSTIHELFEGSKNLFEGLWIEDKWNWQETNPVLHFSFASIDYQGLGLEMAIHHMLDQAAAKHGLVLSATSCKSKFSQLLELLGKQQGKIVLLVDEYDKPIIDYLETEQLPTARLHQEMMKVFYSVLKDASPYLRFVLISGVSKFSKVSVFSDLNSLNDITLHPAYSTLAGYTQAEIERYFDPYLIEVMAVQQLEKPALLEKMRLWYNGYSWDGVQKVYNPFGTLNFLDQKSFGNYWFSTGTPTLLVRLMQKQVKFDFELARTTAAVLDQYSLDALDLTALLFQTGYLTIVQRDYSNGNLVLDYPNLEVKDSMYSFVIDQLAPNRDYQYASIQVHHLKQAFEQNNLNAVKAIVNTLFADLPYALFETDRKTSERFYHSLIHLLFKYLGVYIESEVHTSFGRADSVVQTSTDIYIFEFKHNNSAENALAQIIDKKYADKYRMQGKAIYGIGVNFNFETRSIDGWLTLIL